MFVLDLPSDQPRLLTEPTQPTRRIGNVLFDTLAISPDGTHAAIIANPPDDDAMVSDLVGATAPGYRVWMMNLDTREIRPVSQRLRVRLEPADPRTLTDLRTSFQHIAWSPDGKYLAAFQTLGSALPNDNPSEPGPEDQVWRIWDAKNGREVRNQTVVAQKDIWLKRMAFSPEGSLEARIVSSDNAGGSEKAVVVQVTSAGVRQVVKEINLAGTSFENAVLWAPDGAYLLVVSGRTRNNRKSVQIRAIRTTDWSIERECWEDGDMGRIALSRDKSKLVALCGTDLLLWDWRTGEKQTEEGPAGENILAVDWVELKI